MKKLTINRKLWHRGNIDSDLRLGTRSKYCCIGLYCRAKNIPVKKLIDVSTPEDLFSNLGRTISVKEKLGKLLSDDNENSIFTNNLIAINDYELDNNDSVYLIHKNGNQYTRAIKSEADRERLIKQQFKLIGVEVEFIN